ncbi:MAG: hypothetical protein RBT70_05040 [Alphaproteobacteria bacterium]|nr:hypothetical protein [Alphaproteobacteria bacterium]
MIVFNKQVRNILALAVLCWVLPQSLAYALPSSEGLLEKKAHGASGAGGDKTLTIPDLWDQMGDALGSLFPDPLLPQEGKGSDTGMQDQKDSQDKPKMIEAKKLDATPQKPQTDKVEPYKVYATPVPADNGMAQAPVADDSQVAPANLQLFPMQSAVSQRVQDDKAPTTGEVPLPAVETWIPEEAKQVAAQPAAVQIRAEEPALQQQAPSHAPAGILDAIPEGKAPQTVVAPQNHSDINQKNPLPLIESLPKQYFPLLPLDAGDEAQAQLLPVASNVEMSANHDMTTKAIIVIHDIMRNSEENVAMLMTLTGNMGEETLIMAPQFPISADVLRFARQLPDSGEYVARWPVDMGWNVGGESRLSERQRGISSFTAIDYLLMFLDDRERFPVLNQVVIVGHGMGADFVQRYAAVGKGPEILMQDGLTVRFVVANPSSYLYPTAVIPVDQGTRFAQADEAKCPSIVDYPFGTKNMVSYARGVGANAILMKYPERQIMYLVADKIMLDNYLDRSCAAMAQGQDRLTRGRNFAKYMSQKFGNVAEQNQTFALVPNAGYDPIALYGSLCGLAALFGDGSCH